MNKVENTEFRTCFVEAFKRREATKEISQPQGGWLGMHYMCCPERTQENADDSFVLSGRVLIPVEYQPLCGWLMSIVAPRQDDGFCKAHSTLNIQLPAG